MGCGIAAGLWVPGRTPHAVYLPQVGKDAYFPVRSTCPCNFTLYYEVAARGNIVLSGQQPAHITQQRSKRAAPEKPIRLMHLSETGELGHRLDVPVHPSEALRLGWVPQQGGVSRILPGGEAALGQRAPVPGNTELGPGGKTVTISWRQLLWRPLWAGPPTDPSCAILPPASSPLPFPRLIPHLGVLLLLLLDSMCSSQDLLPSLDLPSPLLFIALCLKQDPLTEDYGFLRAGYSLWWGPSCAL